MSTGVTPNDECMSAYNALRLQKKGRFVLMKFNDTKTEIIVEKVGDRNATLPGMSYFIFTLVYCMYLCMFMLETSEQNIF